MEAMETVLFLYENAYFKNREYENAYFKIEKMHFWSRAPSVISSCPSVKSTRAFCFMVKRGM